MGGRGAASGAAKGRSITWNEAQDMRVKMGQGPNDGEGFVMTSKSWNINAFLRGEPDFNRRSGWNMTEQEIRTVTNRLDRNMRPLPESIQTVRFVDEKFLTSLGLQPRMGPRTVNAIQGIMRRGDPFTSEAFTSVSTNVMQNVFTGRPVKLNITAKKGTKALITTNQQESEIVLGRNQKWKITGARQRGAGGLEIDITVSK